MSNTLTPAELQQYHAYATACESDSALAAEVRAATRGEYKDWKQAIKMTTDATITAYYVALQRAELREWERLTGGKDG